MGNVSNAKLYPGKSATLFKVKFPAKNVPLFPDNNARMFPGKSATPSQDRHAKMFLGKWPKKNVEIFPANNVATSLNKCAKMSPDNNVKMSPGKNVDKCQNKYVKMFPENNVNKSPERSATIKLDMGVKEEQQRNLLTNLLFNYVQIFIFQSLAYILTSVCSTFFELESLSIHPC